MAAPANLVRGSSRRITTMMASLALDPRISTVDDCCPGRCPLVLGRDNIKMTSFNASAVDGLFHIRTSLAANRTLSADIHNSIYRWCQFPKRSSDHVTAERPPLGCCAAFTPRLFARSTLGSRSAAMKPKKPTLPTRFAPSARLLEQAQKAAGTRSTAIPRMKDSPYCPVQAVPDWLIAADLSDRCGICPNTERR
jgi:hypothetical protein